MRALLALLILAPLAGVSALPEQDVHEVTILLGSNLAVFHPKVLVIQAGEGVFWTNTDANGAAHVAAGMGGIDTGILQVGDSSALFRMETPGTYYYHCPFHARMDAEIWVI